MFEFDILCRIYNYINDAPKLKLFTSTLKDSALRWFMGLRDGSILNSEGMKNTFLKKYHEYCNTRNIKTDIFKMQQLEDENLEEYVERFLYNLQRDRNGSLNEYSIKILFLKGIQEEYINTLNLMSSGDISQKYFSNICDLCKKYSRS